MPVGQPDESAAFARNWRTVVVVDFLVGIVVTAAGVAFVPAWWAWLVITAGGIELFFAGGRFTKWRRLRREAGL